METFDKIIGILIKFPFTDNIKTQIGKEKFFPLLTKITKGELHPLPPMTQSKQNPLIFTTVNKFYLEKYKF